MSRLFWIRLDQPGRLAIAARPRAGDWLETEVASWRDAGVQTVVSLLEPAEVRELELQAEESLCRDQGIGFLSFPVTDRGVPESRREAQALADRLASEVQLGSAVVIHCRAGIGRSASLAALVMVAFSVSGAEAFERITEARGVRVPDTDEQHDWVLNAVQNVS